MKFFTSISAGLALAALAVAQPQPRYVITDLGILPGGNFSQATYLNDSRLVAGLATVSGGTQHATFWEGPFHIDVGPSGFNSGAFGVNDRGQASVQAEISSKDPYNENFCAYGTGLKCLPFLWQQGAIIPLPTLGGNNGTVGFINRHGEIAGVAETATVDKQCPKGVSVNGTGPQVLDFEAVIWGPAPGAIRKLPPLAGDTVGIALGINDNGQAVGATGTCANTLLPPIALGAHAVLWDKDGSVHDLGNLGGKANTTIPGVGNIALAINNEGEVSGGAATPDETNSHAFVWTKWSGMRDIGTLPGDVASAGVAINDRGEVVGPSFDEHGNPRAFFWQNGTMFDLNALAANSPLYLLFATAINSRGDISGFGVTGSGDIHAFLASVAHGGNDAGGLSATPSTTPAARSVALPDDLRTLVDQALPFSRYIIGLPRPR